MPRTTNPGLDTTPRRFFRTLPALATAGRPSTSARPARRCGWPRRALPWASRLARRRDGRPAADPGQRQPSPAGPGSPQATTSASRWNWTKRPRHAELPDDLDEALINDDAARRFFHGLSPRQEMTRSAGSTRRPGPRPPPRQDRAQHLPPRSQIAASAPRPVSNHQADARRALPACPSYSPWPFGRAERLVLRGFIIRLTEPERVQNDGTVCVSRNETLITYRDRLCRDLVTPAVDSDIG